MLEAARRLHDLAERFWQFQRYEFPLNALIAGAPNDDPTMFREAPADFERRAEVAAAMLAELDKVPTEGLSLQDRASHRLLARELNDLCEVFATRSHLRPWLLPVGPEFTTIYFANLSQVADAAEASRFADRLATLPGYLADVAACLRAGLAQGLRYPRVVLQSALANLFAAAEPPGETSPWLGPFARSPAAAQPEFMTQRERALQIVQTGIRPALWELHRCIETELLPAARDSISSKDDVDGAAYYDFWLRHFTTAPELDAAGVHALGLSEVARIESAMAQVAAEAGFPGDLSGYRHFLAHGPGFIAPSAEALREQLEVVAKRIDGLLPSFIGRLPRITYGVQSIPLAASERMPPAYAQPGPADASSAGVYWVSSLPEKVPSYLHVPLALHEGWPGHLMHIALMQEQTELPAFRRGNFTKYTACLEGWALYCETLGEDMGLYQTPHQRFGRLDMEMWRACRLVVDTGIHHGGWGREQAIDYMVARLSLSRSTIEAEVDRYVALPAQALAYQIGGLRFRALRERAQARLGARFKLRDFHDQLIGAGAVTLPVLDELIDHWLKDQTHAA